MFDLLGEIGGQDHLNAAVARGEIDIVHANPNMTVDSKLLWCHPRSKQLRLLLGIRSCLRCQWYVKLEKLDGCLIYVIE
jgi:hypothetical protein